MNRTQLLEKKAAEIALQLEEWALRENILNSGEQIELLLSVKKVPVNVVSFQIKDLIPENEALSMPVFDLNLSVRARKVCNKMFHSKEGVVSLGDLIQKSARDFTDIKNCGQTTVFEIREKLAQFGLKLRGD